jgi:3-methyladenine DNA glycosylase AlkD
MKNLNQAKKALKDFYDPVSAEAKKNYFKNCKNDTFLGVKAASVKKIAKEFLHLPLKDILQLMHSNVHEERSLANVILCENYRKGDEKKKSEIFDFYLQNRSAIRDWDGVDDSAPYIAGAHLLKRDKSVLYELVLSEVLWDRRIAMVSTWWFIRHGHLEDTLKLAEILLGDKEDLIHKAVGWMLRELGKRDEAALRQFLETHHLRMPRTALRYAIERFPEQERKTYLAK